VVDGDKGGGAVASTSFVYLQLRRISSIPSIAMTVTISMQIVHVPATSVYTLPFPPIPSRS
jgi:hypothetical protein